MPPPKIQYKNQNTIHEALGPSLPSFINSARTALGYAIINQYNDPNNKDCNECHLS